ncbi:MAG TPA: hypothetical protein VL523_08700 [Terriglobia bacterium]|nr:hypothetical protein [Terriglobia bacterium]
MKRLTNLVLREGFGLAPAIAFLALSCIPARADTIVIGPSSQDVVVENAGGGVIDVWFGVTSAGPPPVCSGSTCTLSGANPTPYTLTTNFPATSLAFTLVSGQDFAPVPNSFTVDVGTGLQTASYTLMYSDGGVDFDGVWTGSNQEFDYTLNRLSDFNGPPPPPTGILTALVSDPVGTEWGATVSTGEFTTTPEPANMFLVGTFLMGAYALFRRRIKS